MPRGIPHYVFSDWRFGDLRLVPNVKPPLDSAAIDAAVREILAERMAEFERALFLGAVAPSLFNSESFTTNAAPAPLGGFNWRYWQRPMT